MTGTGKQFCTFFLKQQLFGIEVSKVQEVIRAQATTEVPLAPAVVTGLINLRGSIVSCIDLRERFCMGAAEADIDPVHLIIQANGSLVSLQVDRVGEVIEVADACADKPPATLTEPARTLLSGVLKLKQDLLQIVDVDRVLEFQTAFD